MEIIELKLELDFDQYDYPISGFISEKFLDGPVEAD
jgi:hypothetical protein